MMRDPSERPVSITTRWFKGYKRRPFDDFNDYVDVVTWADGTTEERHGIPNEWIPILHDRHPGPCGRDHSEARYNGE